MAIVLTVDDETYEVVYYGRPFTLMSANWHVSQSPLNGHYDPHLWDRRPEYDLNLRVREVWPEKPAPKPKRTWATHMGLRKPK
jgi:hypothetical protein